MTKKDVNFISDDESLGDYESYSSSSSDSEVVAEEEDNPGHNDSEVEDNENTDADTVQMDTALIEALQIGRASLNKNSKMAQENTLRSMDWKPVSSAFESIHRLVVHQQGDQPVRSPAGRPPSYVDPVQPSCVAARDADPDPTTTEGEAGVPDTRNLARPRTACCAHAVAAEAAFRRALGDGGRRRVPAGNFGRLKLGPLIDRLQKQFLAGWSLPAVLSFDEGVPPTISKRNTTRMFVPDKPHRYGSKMFMTCDARTACCHRYLCCFLVLHVITYDDDLTSCYPTLYRASFEIHTGKCKSGTSDAKFDHKTGAAAVVRNLEVVLVPNRHAWHAVVIDRFYSSVLLAIELLKMQVCVIGTIMTNRLGYDANVKVEGHSTRPANIPRGTFTFSLSMTVPTMVAFHWWDRKPVHYLCTGSAF
ncbi:unnamed protein product [Phytophthora fragariaefolia]|uniref:Unnamed protein product n=1 Tax=Phytophthora fragariaefolia TaxID=1490495 RepID=A0A9W6TTV0_9STRA|nr:unnamed protein product [Phytophthora fragariaefolia]